MLLAFPVFAQTTKEEVQLEEIEIVIVEVKTWEQEFRELPEDLQRTALCESDQHKDGLPDVDAKNPISTASGIFQMINSTYAWMWTEVYGTPVDWTKKNDPFIQIELSKHLYDKAGLTHWQFPCGTLMR